jgi:hypothetical protein
VIADLLVGAGLLSGRFLPRRARPPVTTDREPICGCEHHVAFHEAGENRCHAKTGPARDRDCTCQKYVGPQPLPIFWPGELGD